VRNPPKEAQLRQRLKQQAAALTSQAEKLALAIICDDNQDSESDAVNCKAFKLAADILSEEADRI
jgi:hypothetical protein